MLANSGYKIDITAELSNALKTNKLLLQIIGGFISITAISTGLGLSLLRDKNVTGGVICGNVFLATLLIATSKKLEDTDEKLQIIYRAELDALCHHVASGQMAKENVLTETYTNISNPQLFNPSILPEGAVSTLPEGLQASITVMEEPEELPEDLPLTVIVEALNRGVSDSKIIEDVMGYKGRRYNDGKRFLDIVKSRCQVPVTVES